MSILIRASAALLAALALCGAPAALAQASTPPPLSAFFANAGFGGAKLSPDARYLAARSGAKGQRDFLMVVDLHNNSGKIVASYSDADVGDFEWVNQGRLIFNTREKNVGQGDSNKAPGLYAVDHDGSNLTQLAERTGGGIVSASGAIGRRLQPWNTFMLDQRGAQDSDFVYVTQPVLDTKREVRFVNLLRLNTRSGASQAVARPGNVKGWMLDHQGEPRLASTSEDGRITLHYREPADGSWRVLTSFAAFGMAPDAFVPVGFGQDGKLFVLAQGGKPTTSLYVYDIKAGKLGAESVLSAAGFDFDGRLVANRDKVLGVLMRTDAVSNEWFDPAMKALQATLDKLLPATINTLSVPADAASHYVLVTSYSDQVPARYALYNKQTGQLNQVADTRPGIEPRQMARQQFVRYKARDGLEIPALLTLPPGAKPARLPLVVLVHGGPHARSGSWGWRADTQFLASRGYAVLEPEFRGSTGFGAHHFQAGLKQWGLKMQDDIADGARWAIDQGLVDPKRICIAGASYGGYATLMGLVNDPDLYQCGINWIGVTDMGLLFDSGWVFTSDASDDLKAYTLPQMVGDPVRDAERFAATSPIRQAARITRPLLLAYGGVDQRVPINHGTRFREAVMRTNKQVEWVEYPEEGHGWALEKNSIDFWTRVEKFLDRHIGSGAPR